MRGLDPADLHLLMDLDRYAFASTPEDSPDEVELSALDPERTYGAHHEALPDVLAGGYSWFDLRLTAPGPRHSLRTLALAGLSWVSVHPDVRRRGVLAAMVRHHLEDLHTQGVALAGLHASEGGIYGRFGYAVASHDVTFTLDRGTRFAVSETMSERADAVTTRTVVDVDDDEVAQRLWAIERDGAVLGSIGIPPRLHRRLLRDVPGARRGREPMHALVATRDGRDVGVAFFVRERSVEDGVSGGTVTVRHISAVDNPALLALARRLVDMDLMSRTVFQDRGTSDPLLLWSGGPRGATMRLNDALWLRPVDVGAALARRGYATACDVVLDITDETCPWNTGRWRLRSDDDGVATCEATDDAPDLRLAVQTFGPLYLGLVGAPGLHAAGAIEQVREGAVHDLALAMDTGLSPIGSTAF